MAKTARLDLRLHPDDDALIRRAAEHRHESVNAFVARAARREAEQVLLERTFAVLGGDEFDALTARLEVPGRVSARLAAVLSAPAPWDRGGKSSGA